jgi:hypothetical protein
VEQIWALIANSEVKNTIVCDAGFAASILPEWDFVVRIDELDPRPGIGWSYDGETFLAPE